MDIETLKRELIRDESCKLLPYLDSVGKVTIGVGRNLSDKGITMSTAMAMLDDDVAETMTELDREVPWWRTLDPVRQRVLANMCFNMGWPRLKGFMLMLAALRDGNYHKAAEEMLSSRWAIQVGQRAERLAEMMERGA